MDSVPSWQRYITVPQSTVSASSQFPTRHSYASPLNGLLHCSPADMAPYFSTQRVTSLFPSWHGSILLHSTGYSTVPQLTGLQHGSIPLHVMGYFTIPQLTGLQHGSILLHVMGYFTIPQLTGLQHGSILLHVMGYFTIPQLTGLQHGSRSTGSTVVPSRHGVFQKKSGPSSKRQLDSSCLPTFPHLGLQPSQEKFLKLRDFFFFF